MKTGNQIQRLAAEFMVIVMGVAVALAADSWRESLVERSLEAEYIEALSQDLQIGVNQLQDVFENTQYVYEATGLLITILEVPSSSQDSNSTINNFIGASRIGFTPTVLQHDATYQELLSTGRLSLIQDRQVRAGLSQYFRQVDRISQVVDGHPPFLLDRFRALTGTVPYNPINTWEDLDAEARARIIQDINQDPRYLEELRSLHARTELLVSRFRFEPAFELNDEIQGLLMVKE